MYLKEIEATGFKSFADKLAIVLDDKITCIVGPNGSGKSNIVDAVRWVLGEQSVKSLRGDGAMSDVIFSGSKSRRALNVASVTLVFDNRDNYLKVPYSEVAIKRRVYRSGENEYFLNGEKCRLKDITDLLLDSGIGKESFNIISQGEVQKILNGSPYDRRAIFEEAAGVLKYKKRKEEALRKLERTNTNLDRVNDIITELSLQVEPLKKQADIAKEYQQTKQNLEKYDVSLLAYDIEELNQAFQKTKEEIEELQAAILTLSNQTTSSTAFLSQEKKELLQLEKEIDRHNAQLRIVTKEVEQLNSERQLLKERSKYDPHSDKVQENVRSLTEEEAKQKNVCLRLEEEKRQLESDASILNQKIEDVKKILMTEQANKRMLEQEYASKDRAKTTLLHQKELLEEELARGGNLPKGVKALLEESHIKGLHNCLGNLIQVEEKYLKALETAIAASKYFIVCESEQDAKNAIFYLKEQRLGRATFFPLSVIKPRGIDWESANQLKQIPGFIGVLDELVTYDKRYHNVIKNQLGTVLVATTLDTANEISRKIKNKYKIITLEGDVIHVGGSMSGGTYYESKSILSLKQSLKKTSQDLNLVTERLQALISKRENVEETLSVKEETLWKYQRELSFLKEKIEEKEVLRTKAEEVHDQIKKELITLEKVVNQTLGDEEQKTISAYYEKVQLEETLLSRLKQLTARCEACRIQIEEKEAQDKLENATLRMQEQKLRALEITSNRLDVKLDNLLKQLSEEYSLTFEKAKEMSSLDIDITEAREKVTHLKSHLKQLGIVNLGAIEEFERVNTRYQFLICQQEDLLKAKETLYNIMNEMDQVMKDELQKTFALVEHEFKKVFQELFQGGTATIKLTDPDNLLETGVEIIASPPGKKLTTITLLSGGEKTLTAISLLFAILNIRTVPFCLFDEVEAALDEANVDQFGRYLDHYKHRTQFLLITHKKKTMEYADTLYGITMQESGVSKLVSVKLDEIQK